MWRSFGRRPELGGLRYDYRFAGCERRMREAAITGRTKCPAQLPSLGLPLLLLGCVRRGRRLRCGDRPRQTRGGAGLASIQ